MKSSMRKQQGISLVGLIMIVTLIILAAALGMKVVPSVTEYYTILADVKATAGDGGLRGAGVPQIRAAYSKRLQVSGASAVEAEDLDITKEGNEVVISFGYSKKIPLFRNVSLMIDFQGSSAGGSAFGG